MVDEIWMNKALSKLGTLQSGTIFTLKDLFEGIEWNKLSSGDRRDFGRQFKYKVNRELIPGVVFYGKAQNNSSQYKRL